MEDNAVWFSGQVLDPDEPALLHSGNIFLAHGEDNLRPVRDAASRHHLEGNQKSVQPLPPDLSSANPGIVERRRWSSGRIQVAQRDQGSPSVNEQSESCQRGAPHFGQLNDPIIGILSKGDENQVLPGVGGERDARVNTSRRQMRY